MFGILRVESFLNLDLISQTVKISLPVGQSNQQVMDILKLKIMQGK